MEPRTGSDFSQILHILQYSAERKWAPGTCCAKDECQNYYAK
jgi:hypothetical protein